MEAVARDLGTKVSLLVEANEVTVVKVLLERDMLPTDEIQAIVERDVSEEYPDAVCTIWTGRLSGRSILGL